MRYAVPELEIMKPIQLILIGVALVAALGAGFLMMNLNSGPAPTIVQQSAPAPQVQMSKVLIAGQDIPMGTALGAERITWQDWPTDNLRESFIVQDSKPEAMEEYASAIARSAFFAGEPIREQKIVRSDSGYLSAILPAGKRAFAIRVQADTSAGGFILPNDHVDVVLTYRGRDGADEIMVTDTVVENVRVLAIDQVIEEQDGEKAKVGDTATLELSSEQVESLSEAGARGTLRLALRSVEDAESHKAGPKNKRRGKVRLIRFGKASEVKANN